MKITRVHGREILDSRGNPTVEVDVISTVAPRDGHGAFGCLDRRKRSPRTARRRQEQLPGQGCTGAVANVNGEIAGTRSGATSHSAASTSHDRLDGTPTKNKLGANAHPGRLDGGGTRRSSLARVPLYRHLATLFGNDALTLPVPMMNILNGGAHADTISTSRNSWLCRSAPPSSPTRVGEARRFSHVAGHLESRQDNQPVSGMKAGCPEPEVQPRGNRGHDRGSRRRRAARGARFSSHSMWRPANSRQEGPVHLEEIRRTGTDSDQMIGLYEEWCASPDHFDGRWGCGK